MRSRWIALLAVTGAAIAIAVTAWPATAKQRKPLAIHTAPPLQLSVTRTLPGAYDPHYFVLSQLIPRGSRISEVWYPPARRYRQLDMPYYIRNNPMCCPSFIEHLRLRWDGRRFVRASVHIDMTDPYSTG